MVGDGGGDVCWMINVVEWFMYGSLYGEISWLAFVAIFCVDEEK